MMSLLGSFRREKSKIKNSFGTGKGRKDIYSSKWFAFERLKFIMDRDDPRPTIDTISRETISDDSHSSNTENEIAQDSNTISNLFVNDDCIEEDEINSCFEPSTSVKPPPVKRQKKKVSSIDDTRLDEAFNILKQSSLTQQRPLSGSAIFGQHVANKLDTYTHKTRAVVEHSINNILFEADLGRYENYYQNFVQHFPQNQNTHLGSATPVQSENYQDTQLSSPSTHSIITNPDSPYDSYNLPSIIPDPSTSNQPLGISTSYPRTDSNQNINIDFNAY